MKTKLQVGFIVFLILAFIANRFFHFGTERLDRGLLIFSAFLILAWFGNYFRVKKKKADLFD